MMLATYCTNFSEEELANTISDMQKGSLGLHHIYLHGLDIFHLTVLINSWWNNEPMDEELSNKT